MRKPIKWSIYLSSRRGKFLDSFREDKKKTYLFVDFTLVCSYIEKVQVDNDLDSGLDFFLPQVVKKNLKINTIEFALKFPSESAETSICIAVVPERVQENKNFHCAIVN